MKGKWKLREDVFLLVCIEYQQFDAQARNLSDVKWSEVANLFRIRNDVQVRERWTNVLSPELKLTLWTQQEDFRLLELAQRSNGKWSEIAKEIGNKTDNQCSRRWKILIGYNYNKRLLETTDLETRIRARKPVFVVINTGRLQKQAIQKLKTKKKLRVAGQRD